MQHELLLIKTFIIKERQERYTNLISTERGRKKFRQYVAHFKDLNLKYCILLPFNFDSQIVDLLKAEGAPDLCYIISENSQYDAKYLSLTDSIRELFNSGISYFLSCIPGKLAYYEGEDLNQKFILKT
jgi:hypothetical protein